MNRRVRRATAADLDALAMIEASLEHPRRDRASFAADLALAFARVEVLELEWSEAGDAAQALSRGAGVVAYAVVWFVTDELQLLDIAVHSGARRSGHGSALLAHLLGSARARGCSRVTLEVRASNLAARALYRAAGFVEDGVRPRYYAPDGEDAILMSLALVPQSA